MYREVSGSNLSWDTGYPDRVSLLYAVVPPDECGDFSSLLFNDRFLLNLLRFVPRRPVSAVLACSGMGY